MRSYSYLKQSLLKPKNPSLQAKIQSNLYSKQTKLKHVFPNDSFGDSRRKEDKEDYYNNENDKPNKVIPIPAMPVSNEYNNYRGNTDNNDSRIEYVLNLLDITYFNEILKTNQMNFNDLLFLSREDLDELGLSMVHRNRLKRFCESYQQFASDYSYEEIMLFFKKNKNFNFTNAQRYQNNQLEVISSNDNDLNNNYNSIKNEHNDSYLSKEELKYFIQEEKKTALGNRCNNEVFIPHNTPLNIKDSSYSKNNSKIENESSPLSIKKDISNKSHISSKPITIEHVELEFSRSSSPFTIQKKIPVNRKKNHSHHIVSTYNKINREIEAYLSTASINKNTIKQNSDSKCQCALINGSQFRKNHGRFNSLEMNNDYYKNTKQFKYKLTIPTGYSRISTYNSNKNNITIKYNDRLDVLKNNQSPENDNRKLNRNRSLTDLHKGNNNINSLEQLTQFIKRKEYLRSNLNECNNKINENRKVSFSLTVII